MLIKIKSGIYGHIINGRVRAKTAQDEPFEVEEAEALRLVSLGIACCVNDTPVATPAEGKINEGAGRNKPESGDVPETTDSGESDEGEKGTYDSNSSVQHLWEIAKANGIPLKVGMTKDEMLDVLDAFFAEDDTPDLSAEDPVE